MVNKVRKYINTNIIGKNQVLVEEMRYYNHNYGRPDKLAQRAARMAGLVWNYGVLKKHPIDRRGRIRERLIYPESKQPVAFDEKLLWKLLEEKEILVIDFWQVLFYFSLSEEQLWVLLETYTVCPGLAETMKMTKQVPGAYKEQYEALLADFSIKNQRIFQLIEQAKEKNKRVFIRVNQKEERALTADRLIEENHLEKWQEAEQERKEKVLYLTATPLKNKTCVLYKNVNSTGAPYRSHIQENVAVQLYNQIVNLKLHSGSNSCSLFYEYGFVYGGILTCGFSQFLNRLVEQEKIDKLLFVARDGDILEKIYREYFGKAESSYLIFSRAASFELVFQDFPEEYIDKNIKARIYSSKQKNSIKKVLQECGIGQMEKALINDGIDTKAVLSEENYPILRDSLLAKQEEIRELFRKSREAAKRYFLSEVEECKNICIVDVGWHGKSIVYLNYLLKKSYGFKGKVIGAQIGASADRITQQHIQNGLIFPFAFDNEYWRNTDNHKKTYMSDGEIIGVEALFSSPEKTLLRYGDREDGTIDFIYGEQNKNREGICEIHKGIKDFTQEYSYYLRKYNLKLSSRDSYTPLDSFLRNKRNLRLLLKEYKEGENIIHSHRGEG
ncbi:MAG: hypothetical protein IKW28_02635 [Lachnospiraceae bacterium]|nr:hypothetical protein [Lachnospiraceae bacterium]